MKKTHMLQLLMFLFLLVGYTVASAQADYVVTIKSDTLYGTVKFLNYGKEQSVQLTPAEGKKKTYSILQTRAFVLDGETYQPVRTNEGYLYMKLLRKGYLSLYASQLPNQTGWDGRFFVKRDASALEIPNLGFKKNVSRFLSDCEWIEAKIESGALSKQNLEAIVDEYNACLATKGSQQQTTPAANTPVIEQKPTNTAWATLEKEVSALEAFTQKNDALEMIRDIQTKLSRNEKIPGFLVNGLKDILKDQTSLKDTLDKAVAELN
jgi:hypothetical protein